MSPLSRYVVRNLTSRPLTTLMTLGSMSVVGFALAGILAAWFGLQAAFRSAGRDDQVLVMSHGAQLEAQSHLARDELLRVAAMPSVLRAAPQIYFESYVVLPDRTAEFVFGRALDPDDAKAFYAPRLIEGRWPDNGRRELMVGAALRARHNDLAPGAKLPVGTREYQVVGTFETRSSFDAEAWTSRDALTQDLRLTSLHTILAATASPAEAAALAARVTGTRGGGLKATVESSYYGSILGRFSALRHGLLLVLGLLVAGASLSAGATLSVLFRRRVGDLSVLRALGFRDRRVALLMLVESELTAIVGGAIGIGFAWVLAYRRTAYVFSSGVGITFRAAVEPPIAGAVLAALLFIAGMAVVWPIVQMLREHIMKGLREE